MFTGIIEEVGKVEAVSHGAQKSKIIIRAKKVLSDVKMGDSISVNGVCLTVVHFDKNIFEADVMNETFLRSNLGGLKRNDGVNLERAMSADDRFGGHIVSGHIDGIGVVKNIKKDGNAVWFEIATSEDILVLIVDKGSIAIDGISLTVAALTKDTFKVSVIPHTLGETILFHRKVGDKVNLENDVIGKYIKRFLGKQEYESSGDSGLTREKLLSSGF